LKISHGILNIDDILFRRYENRVSIKIGSIARLRNFVADRADSKLGNIGNCMFLHDAVSDQPSTQNTEALGFIAMAVMNRDPCVDELCTLRLIRPDNGRQIFKTFSNRQSLPHAKSF